MYISSCFLAMEAIIVCGWWYARCVFWFLRLAFLFVRALAGLDLSGFAAIISFRAFCAALRWPRPPSIRIRSGQSSSPRDQVGPEFLASEGVFVSSFDDFCDHGVIIDLFYGLYFESSIAAFERFSVDEFDEGSDGLLAGDVGDVYSLYDADRVWCL